jgi:hypothetical protein
MNPAGWGWVSGGVGAVALATFLAGPTSTVVGVEQVERGDALTRLGPGRIGQVFRSPAPGLVGIDLVVTSTQRPAPAARMRLRDVAGGIERLDRALPLRLPGGHEYVETRFAPLWDSEARTYEVSIEREAPLDRGQLVVWGRAGVPPPAGGLTRDAVPAAGDLAFRAWYRMTGWAALRVFFRRWASTGLGAWTWGAGLAVVVAYGTAMRALLRSLRP